MVTAIQAVKMESSENFHGKRVISMADAIESIPEKMRWEVATKGLTGAYIAISNALKQAVGQQKFEEFNGPRSGRSRR